MRERARMRACGPTACVDTREKHERAHKHAPGGGSSRARFPSVLSQLLVTGVTQLQAMEKKKKMTRGKWGDGKTEAQIERWW